MSRAFAGEVERLRLNLAGHQLTVVLERRGPAAAPLWLLLPALSTVSSRSEWLAFVEAVGDQRQLVSFDWLGFGESDRPPMDYDASLQRFVLQGVLDHLASHHSQPVTVVAAGHSASLALSLAAECSNQWQGLIAVAPTWRGPLPTMTGWSPQSFGWLRQLLAAPLIGPALYWLNTSRPVLQVMLRRHVWMNPALLTQARIFEQQSIARQPVRATRVLRLSAVDWMPPHIGRWWRQQATLLKCPLHVVLRWSGFSGQAPSLTSEAGHCP